MKIEHYPFDQKDMIFDKADPMHDCFFSDIRIENDSLILIYNNLKQYHYFDKGGTENYCYADFDKLTLIYHFDHSDATEVEREVSLTLREFDENDNFKEKIYSGTVEPLKGATCTMLKFSVDMWSEMTLYFNANIEGIWYDAELTFRPRSLEYIWE